MTTPPHRREARTPGSREAASSGIRFMSWGMRFVGCAMIIFFAIGAVAAITEYAPLVDDSDGLGGELFAWTAGHGLEYVVMICTIYVAWGVFAIIAATDPVRHELFVLFTIFGNFAHMGVMFIMSFGSGHHMHLLGDVPLGLGIPVLISILWVPYRRSARAVAALDDSATTR